MPRKIRIEYPGALYVVSSRGGPRQKIFYENFDYEDFVNTMGEACQKTGFRIHAYCLTPEQFYFVVETPQANLVAGMRWFMSCYTLHLNRRRRLRGNVVSGRYKSLIVDGKENEYLQKACEFVHLIPAHRKLVKDDMPVSSYPWSSMQAYLMKPSDRPSWIETGRLWAAYGIRDDNAAGRKKFEQITETRRRSAPDEEWAPFYRGWYLGRPAFGKQLLEKMEVALERHRAGRVKGGSAEKRAAQIISEELELLGWSASELVRRRKSDPAKLVIAERLRRETTVSIGWIAQRLHTGTEKSTRGLLYRWMKFDPSKEG